MKIINLKETTEYQKLQCQIFAKYVIETNEDVYKRRGSSSTEKIMQDIKLGKLAECAVYNHCIEARDAWATPPDFTIFPPSKKDFGADLNIRGFDIHVKSCLDKSSYPNSWLFQKSDSLVSNPGPKDILALCVLKEGDSYAYMCHPSEIEFEEPVNQAMKRTKVAIYEKELTINNYENKRDIQA